MLPSTRDLGDELRILRFIGDLKSHVAEVVVLTDPRLHPLLESSFPGVICCDPSEILPMPSSPTWRPKSVWPNGLDRMNNSCRPTSAH